MAEQLHSIDAAVRASRRQLMGALLVIVAIGAPALLNFTVQGSRAGQILWTVLPVVIAISVATMRGMGGRIDAKTLDAVRNDELRQASLQRAWRNGFFAVLGLQPALALALSSLDVANPAGLMAAASAMLGTATVLASLLWYDR